MAVGGESPCFFLEQESLHGWQGRAAPVRAHVCSWPVEELHSGVGAVGPTRTRPTRQTLQLPSGSASRLPDIEVKLQRTQANLAVRRPQGSSLRSRCKRIIVGSAADVADELAPEREACRTVGGSASEV